MTFDSDNPCPVGHIGCEYVAELVRLRQQLIKLQDQVQTDHLTGLYNHRYFHESLDREMERALRSRQCMALIMLDLDHFKRVNDEWGHEVGNIALQHLAQLMRQMMRRIDIQCRYGGEEFAIISPNTNLPHAVSEAERLREAIEKTPIIIGERQLHLTASMGIAIYHERHQVPGNMLIREADAFLYQAKQEGRNRIAHPLLQPASSTQVSSEERDLLFS